jgi:hypothetical protein
MKKLLLGLTLLTALTACPTPIRGGGDTGSANLTFTNPTGGYNGSTATLSSTTALAGVIMEAGTGTGASKRTLQAFLPLDSREAGVTYVIKDIFKAGVNYLEGNDPSTGQKLWTVTGGSIRVVAKSGRTLTFELINVTLSNNGTNISPAVGTITVNGTMTGESLTPL